MYFTYCILIVFTLKLFSFGQHHHEKKGLDKLPSDDSEEDPGVTEKPDADNHSFVALIDVVFNDGGKRTCTGTIIHDNVVITAGHCFMKETYYGEKVDAELTASFIVIGTKKMFESGYEQYLPIEKVIAHPKFKGWTANLALVYTFAGMTSDKPGIIVPLAGDRTSTPVDSNATILSWGHCKEDVQKGMTTVVSSDSSCEDSSEDTSGADAENTKKYKGTKSDDLGSSPEEDLPIIGLPNTQSVHNKRSRTTGIKADRKKATSHRKLNSRFYRQRALYPTTPKKRQSRYLVHNSKNRNRRFEHKLEDESLRSYKQYDNKSLITSEEDISEIIDKKHSHRRKKKQLKSYYKDWRRRMGTTQNKLTAEVFGFVNVQACKKLIEKATPAVYHTNGNDIVCYASEDHYITDEDAGAPAIQSGYLVAVTVGGVECEGEHVAVGMKMSCYCSWIRKNLPDNVQMNCCKDCCDVFHTVPANTLYRKHRNKYLY